jgi:hypothetical protein
VRGPHHRRRPAAKLVAGLVPVALILVAAAAYAAVRPGVGDGPEHYGSPAAPVKAPATIPFAVVGSAGLRIAEHPPALSSRRTARFHTVAAGEPELRCRLDRQPAKPCEATVVYHGLSGGNHTFLVAARQGHRTVRADFGWRVLEPEAFEVEPRPASVGPLSPGAAPLPIRVVISNPNPVPIVLTALRVAASGGAAGCDPAANVALTAPNLSKVQPRIPANGTLTLPSPDVAAPTIALRELGVDQDACQGASFDLSFSGSAGA